MLYDHQEQELSFRWMLPKFKTKVKNIMGNSVFFKEEILVQFALESK